jgi:FtsX-like permease family
LLPGVLWTQLEGQEKRRITLDMVTAAEQIAGLEFTDAERQLLIDGVNEHLDDYQRLREIPLRNSVASCLTFSPVVPGMKFDMIRRPMKRSEPPKVVRPSNLEKVAFWPVTELAALISSQQVKSVELTQMYFNPQPEMFVPLSQVRDGVMAFSNRFAPISWVVRTSVAPFSLAAPIERIFRDLADMPVAHVRTMDQVVVRSTSRNQFNTFLLGLFAFVAILLASIGLSGLIAYSIQQRTHEFGIRLALGADSVGLRNMIVGQAMKLAAAGVAVGLGASYGLTKLMVSLLHNVKPTDAPVFVSVAVLLSAIALVASYLPARRALRIDPVIALRYE